MNTGLNRFSILFACATFFLIIAGALVTSNDAGLATEDWPLSNGQVFPKMVVKLMLPLWVSSAHATLAQLFFCITVSLAVFTSRSWIEAQPLSLSEEKGTL